MFNPNETILAGASRPMLQAWLKEAQEAYVHLTMGRREVSVSYDGKSVTYSEADKGALVNMIELLQRQLGMRSRARRALTPFFR